MKSRRIFTRAAWALAALCALVPSVAHADPITAVAIFITTSLPFISAAVDTFIFFAVQSALYLGISYGVNKLFGPKSASQDAQQRQASVMSLTLGEAPRELIFGRAATGGTLLDAFNFGGDNSTDWEVLVVKVADHKCDALEGYYINDTFYDWPGDGVQGGFNSQLEIYFMDGSAGQAANSYLVTQSAARLYGTPWTTDDVFASMAYVVVAYKADAPNATAPVWPQGRPQFKWQLRGKLCYDPRLDSTIDGGSGAHRWDTPSTWAWSENAAVCDYNYDRGIYAQDAVSDPTQLLIGRGLSAEEASPERVAARANLCDEAVTLKAGGTEPRYRVGGVVFSNESFRDIKQKFADAMGGDIVKRQGGVEVLPGASQSVVREITDHDLVIGDQVAYEPFLSDVDRVNVVTPRYVEPAQLWQSHAAPVRRSTDDIVDDGGQKIADVALDLVTSQTQAQRIGEIKRRLARKEQRAALVLAPRHADLEDGDWIGWTSDRYLNGGRAVFRIDAYSVQQNWRNNLVLREVASTCYDWVAATDEGVPGSAPVDEFGSLEPVTLTGVTCSAIAKVGASGTSIPALRMTWDAPVDPAILRIRCEVREAGGLEVAPTLTDDVDAGSMDVTNGVGPDQLLEARLVPLGVPGRPFTPSSWFLIGTTDTISQGLAGPDGVITAEDLYNFLWLIDLNLATFAEYLPVGGTTTLGVPPAAGFTTFGEQQQALVIPGGSPSHKAERTGTAGLAVNGYAYAHAFRAATTDVGGSTLRLGFRDGGGSVFPSVPDQVYSLTTTPTLFTWDPIASDDAGWDSPAVLAFYDNSGDIALGETVTVTDLMINLGGAYGPGLVSPWRPSPNEVDLLRHVTLLQTLYNAKLADNPGQRLQVSQFGTIDVVPAGPASLVTEATTARTLIASDAGGYIRTTNTSGCDITVPPNSAVPFKLRTVITLRQVAATGVHQVVAGLGVTVHPPHGGTLILSGPGALVQLVKVGVDEWDLLGQTT